MPVARISADVTPLRRAPHAVDDLVTVDALAAATRPDDPVYCIRPRTLRLAAARFVRGFLGDVLYAVKCNPEPAVLRAIWQGGIRHFDCASIGEIRLVRGLFPTAHIHYMHPIKPSAAIVEAYGQHRVRDFSLDSVEELDKIEAATNHAADLGFHVRLALPKGDALYDLSGKFGVEPSAVAQLLRRARSSAARVGVCFHVGSQCMDPASYERGLALTGQAIAESGVRVDVVDVGGGFPVSYPDVTPPPLGRYFTAIERGFRALGLPAETGLWCEPGRALAAPGASLVVKVEARRGQTLHINDGIYGGLNDAGVAHWRFPVRLIRPDGDDSKAEKLAFSFFGPTCDSSDYMKGPFLLPGDIGPGDWIEIGQLGAYGVCLRTDFNGFDRLIVTEVTDPPLLATPGHADRPLGGRSDPHRTGTPRDHARRTVPEGHCR